VLLTHLHVDHSADLPVLIKASYFGERDRELAVYGPSGNQLMPNLGDFLDGLFGQHSDVYRYLSDYLGQGGAASYQLQAVEVDAGQRKSTQPAGLRRVQLTAVGVHHGPVPALAWRIEAAGASVAFSGDMNGDYRTLPSLARHADLLVAHHAVSESARGAARDLHMPPSLIGRIARQAQVKKLVLSHRMRRTLGHEQESLEYIRASYQGPVEFADDLDCYVVASAPRDADER
jgi:ribonuclease BN (tRNA processing enzyme)